MAEPVAWMDGQGNLYRYPDDADRGQTMRPLYLEREWVNLTDNEIKDIIGSWGDTPVKGYTRKLMDQIQDKLKEKNNG